jgi:hypothetical protein
MYWDRITPTNITPGILDSVGSTSGTRIIVPDYTTGSVGLTLNTECLVYKNASCNAVVGVTGTSDAKVMFTTGITYISTGGFCIGERVHVSAPAAGNISLLALSVDGRAAVRGEVVSIWNTTSSSNNDFRLAVRYDEASYWNTLTSLSEDYRLAVRMSSHETLYTTGTLFDVVNLFARADETRQMTVVPSPNRVGDIQNYIKVVV